MIPIDQQPYSGKAAYVVRSGTNIDSLRINDQTLSEEQIAALYRGEVVQLVGVSIRLGGVAPTVDLIQLKEQKTSPIIDRGYMNSFLKKKQKRRY